MHTTQQVARVRMAASFCWTGELLCSLSSLGKEFLDSQASAFSGAAKNPSHGWFDELLVAQVASGVAETRSIADMQTRFVGGRAGRSIR